MNSLVSRRHITLRSWVNYRGNSFAVTYISKRPQIGRGLYLVLESQTHGLKIARYAECEPANAPAHRPARGEPKPVNEQLPLRHLGYRTTLRCFLKSNMLSQSQS